MAKGTGAAFDLALKNELRDPTFRAAFRREVKLLKSEQRLLAALDRAREYQSMTKTELAKRTDTKLSSVSRLLSRTRSRPSNPRLDTLLEVIDALDLHVTVDIRPREPHQRKDTPWAVSTHF